MSILRRLLNVVFGEDDPARVEQRVPRTDEERLALAVLAGDEEAALALADLVLMTYHRLAKVPPGVSFESAPWPRRARAAFRRMGIRSFKQLILQRKGEAGQRSANS
jgi:hypothetical protein